MLELTFTQLIKGAPKQYRRWVQHISWHKLNMISPIHANICFTCLLVLTIESGIDYTANTCWICAIHAWFAQWSMVAMFQARKKKCCMAPLDGVWVLSNHDWRALDLSIQVLSWLNYKRRMRHVCPSRLNLYVASECCHRVGYLHYDEY